MEKDIDIMEIECRIVLIADSDHVKDHVDIVLEPVDQTMLNPSNNDKGQQPVLVNSGGPFGSIGIQVQEMLPPDLKKMMGAQVEEEDPRVINLIENKIDFAARDWQYGDIIIASFRKKK